LIYCSPVYLVKQHLPTTALCLDKDGVRRRQQRRSLPLLIALFKALLQAQTVEADAALLPWRLKDL
jgi:hypothetical protein